MHNIVQWRQPYFATGNNTSKVIRMHPAQGSLHPGLNPEQHDLLVVQADAASVKGPLGGLGDVLAGHQGPATPLLAVFGLQQRQTLAPAGAHRPCQRAGLEDSDTLLGHVP